MKHKIRTALAISFLLAGSLGAQSNLGLPVWPLNIPGTGNNDAIIDFAHGPTITNTTVPLTTGDMSPCGTGLGLDGCGHLVLYFLPKTTTYAPSFNINNPACFQENTQEMRVYDKNGNSLLLCDPNWNLTNTAPYLYYMDAVSGDREFQVIPRQGLPAGAPLQWFVIYNEPYKLLSTDYNTTYGYGYYTNEFPTGYRPSRIKYSLIEYDPLNHAANPLRRVQPDNYLTASLYPPYVYGTYAQGKATDLPDANGNYNLYVAETKQLTYNSTTGWSNSANIHMEQFQINSAAGTIKFVPEVVGSGPYHQIMNLKADGFLVPQSSIEVGQVGSSPDDYKIVMNNRNEHNYPSLLFFSKSFSNVPRIISLDNQRRVGSNKPFNLFHTGLDIKVGGIEWDATGQYLYVTDGNGAANADAYLFQLNTNDYNSVSNSYSGCYQNQDYNASPGPYAIGDIERGFNDQLYITKTYFGPSPLWMASTTLFGIDGSLLGSAFQNDFPGHSIDFGSNFDYTYQVNSSSPVINGLYGFTFLPDGIDGYDYSNGKGYYLNPAFTLSTSTPVSGNPMTVSATVQSLPACARVNWTVCQVDASGTAIAGTCMTNSTTWTTGSQVPVCTFPGYTFYPNLNYSFARDVLGCCVADAFASQILWAPLPSANPGSPTSKKAEDLADYRNQQFQVFPNPSDGAMQVNYVLDKGQTGQILISDMTGRILSRYPLVEGQTNIQLHEEGLNIGTYFYSIYADGERMKTGRFVITR